MKRFFRVGVASVALVALMVGFVGCGDDDDDEASATAVEVVLSEWIVEPTPASVSAGPVTFTADNKGGELHELLVVRSDTIESLPVAADGSLDEDGLAEGAFIGEVEDVESGATKTLTLDLPAGSYVLLCNVVDVEPDGGAESHFAEGMAALLAVE